MRESFTQNDAPYSRVADFSRGSKRNLKKQSYVLQNTRQNLRHSLAYEASTNFIEKSTKSVVFLQARPKSLVRPKGLTEKKQYETMVDTTCTKILSRHDLVDPPRRLK